MSSRSHPILADTESQVKSPGHPSWLTGARVISGLSLSLCNLRDWSPLKSNICRVPSGFQVSCKGWFICNCTALDQSELPRSKHSSESLHFPRLGRHTRAPRLFYDAAVYEDILSMTFEKPPYSETEYNGYCSTRTMMCAISQGETLVQVAVHRLN